MPINYFGTTKDDKTINQYVWTNKNGMQMSIIDLGATVTSLKIPTASGQLVDVVLGYDKLSDYQEQTSYFGAVIGRNANRISHGRVTIGRKDYQLEQNDGENNLHSGSNGFHTKIWEVRERTKNSIAFSCFTRSGEQGFPGNMTARVIYTLTDDNELKIQYDAVTDETTVANFTNHMYFNLDGHDSGSVEEQELEILASYYTPVIDKGAIPTGEIAKVTNTPMDFRKTKKIGAEINADFAQLLHVGGYDHNYVLDKADGTLQLAARAKGTKSNISMDVYTDCVGLQFYTGNFIGKQKGKGGVMYDSRHGFCLETQYFPNAMMESNFKSPILRPGDKYHSVTTYRFKG